MDDHQEKTISKFLSLLLRHRPESAGLTLDDEGWVGIDALLNGMAAADQPVTHDQLRVVVQNNDKQRFQFSDDGRRIRATQGHSVDVDLGYEKAAPPESLLHGTPEQFVASIRRQGLLKQKRHHVHLHTDVDVASAAGARRGRPVLLNIAAERLAADGHDFYVTPNGVWLTDHVPPEYIQFPAPA